MYTCLQICTNMYVHVYVYVCVQVFTYIRVFVCVSSNSPTNSYHPYIRKSIVNRSPKRNFQRKLVHGGWQRQRTQTRRHPNKASSLHSQTRRVEEKHTLRTWKGFGVCICCIPASPVQPVQTRHDACIWPEQNYRAFLTNMFEGVFHTNGCMGTYDKLKSRTRSTKTIETTFLKRNN